MGWTGKGMDPEVLTTTLMGVIEQALAKMNSVTATDAPQIKTIDIVEYQNRMRVTGMEKFNAPSFVSIANYYLTPSDMEKHRAKGALVLYVDLENAGKLFKALGFTVPEDEDDSSMMDINGEFCGLLVAAFKSELVRLGYVDLVVGGPHNYKNSVMEGVEYSPDQQNKLEFSFFYWKRKAIVVELTLAAIPLKK